MTDIRNLVLDILAENENTGAYISDIVLSVQEKYAFLEERDRAFIKLVSSGVVGKKIALDHVIDNLSSVKTVKMKPVILHIIRMACFEILYMDHIPARASVNEAVRLTKKRHMTGLSGFVNAVTRKIAALHESGGIAFPNDRIRYSCPEYIYGLLISGYGKEKTEGILKSLDQKKPLYLRVNSLKCSVSELEEILKKEGIDARKAPFGNYALAASGFNVSESRAFKEGLYSVQDISSMAAIEAAGVKEGMTVIDICAAPGGKACYVSELMKNTGRVLAFDLSPEKTRKIEENAERLGLKNIDISVKDASVFDEELEGLADLVIADLPCSGLGVMNRKVDIKYRITEEDIKTLTKLQRDILDNVCRYIKQGGHLLYSTCTLTGAENHDQSSYIEEKFRFRRIVQRQFVQGTDPCDGFYFAVYEK